MKKGPKHQSNYVGSARPKRRHSTQNNTQWVFYLSEELYDINYQTNSKDFQSSGNKCRVDISHP